MLPFYSHSGQDHKEAQVLQPNDRIEVVSRSRAYKIQASQLEPIN